MSGWPPCPPLAASSNPTTAIVLPPPERRQSTAPTASCRFRFPHALQRAGSGTGKSTTSTAALVPSFCSIGTILPSRPARSQCRRPQRRSTIPPLPPPPFTAPHPPYLPPP